MTVDTDYALSLLSGETMQLTIPATVFQPTGTTSALFETVRSELREPGSVLDIGCGSGVLGLALFKEGLVLPPLCASDLSEDAVECVRENAESLGVTVDARCGSLFEPWEKMSFDVIVDDVAGVAQGAAKISPWYHKAPCPAGEDGTELVCQIIAQARAHLNPHGRLFFPIISLSNVDRIVEIAHQNFSEVKKLSHKQWPLPQEMLEHRDLLYELKNQGHIRFEEKFGMMLFYTDVYGANGPK